MDSGLGAGFVTIAGGDLGQFLEKEILIADSGSPDYTHAV